jgi:hypothetical protein
VITLVGGGMGYLLWLKTRPKKETWFAKVYQLSDGVRPARTSDGTIVGDLKLQDLRAYTQDVLEKVEKEKGIVVYRLQGLNKATPAVEGDVVENWGNGRREVSVLLHKGGCTLLKKGYDKQSGEAIFDPLPHSRINMIKSEMATRKDRLQKEKDILQAITPWIVTGICMLGLVAIAYVQINGFIEVSDNNLEAAKHMDSAADKYLQVENLKYGIPTTRAKEIVTPPAGARPAVPSVE